MISVSSSLLVVGSGTWALDAKAHSTDVRMDDWGVRLGCCIACGQTARPKRQLALLTFREGA